MKALSFHGSLQHINLIVLLFIFDQTDCLYAMLKIKLE